MMGIFDFMKKRRERESAIPGGLSTAADQTGFTAPPLDSANAGPGTEVSTNTSEVAGVQGLGALGQILSQALSGNPSVMVSDESQVMNLQGQDDDLRNSILETLKSHGIDAEKGQAVEIDDPAVVEEITSKLSALGLDPSNFGGPGAFGMAAPGVAADALRAGDSIGQLERLGKLHEQGILTDAEFTDQKRKILGE